MNALVFCSKKLSSPACMSRPLGSGSLSRLNTMPMSTSSSTPPSSSVMRSAIHGLSGSRFTLRMSTCGSRVGKVSGEPRVQQPRALLSSTGGYATVDFFTGPRASAPRVKGPCKAA
jgi:hypothetical protein